MYLSMYHAIGATEAMDEGWLDFWKPWTVVRGWRDNRENVRGGPGPLSLVVSCRLFYSATGLLNNEHDPNEAGSFPLQCFAIMEWDEMVIPLLQHGSKVTELARQPYLNPQRTIVSILRLYIAISNREPWDVREDGERPKKLEAVGKILDSGFDSPTLNEKNFNNTSTFAALIGNKHLAEMLILRSQSQPWLEAYVSSALTGMMTYFHPSRIAHLHSMISTLLKPLNPESKCNALNCALHLFLKDEAVRNELGMKVVIAIFRARQALDKDYVATEESVKTASSLSTLTTEKYGLTPHGSGWRPMVANATPVYGPGERDLFVPVYRRPRDRNILLQDGSALFFETQISSNSEETQFRGRT